MPYLHRWLGFSRDRIVTAGMQCRREPVDIADYSTTSLVQNFFALVEVNLPVMKMIIICFPEILCWALWLVKICCYTVVQLKTVRNVWPNLHNYLRDCIASAVHIWQLNWYGYKLLFQLCCSNSKKHAERHQWGIERRTWDGLHLSSSRRGWPRLPYSVCCIGESYLSHVYS